MKTKLHLLAASAVVLAADVHAQSILGTVRTVAGVPINGVLVRATRTSPFQRVTASTDVTGVYVLGSGLSGTYAVDAIEPGYTFTPASTNVTVSGSSVMVNFTVLATVPDANTGSAVVRATSATLRGTVNPNGAAATAWFEYGLTASYGSLSGVINDSHPTLSFFPEIAVSNLLNATTYHYRLMASNSAGIQAGNDLTFTTLAGIPTVTTLVPTGGDATAMILNGSLVPNGANATARFEWGTTTNYGNATPPQSLGDGVSQIRFNQAITGLITAATYHYRAVAMTSFATNYGADVSFMPLFSPVASGLPEVWSSSVAWGDYDNDGRLDILLNGFSDAGPGVSQVWRNTGSGFTDISAGLTQVGSGSVAWGDYDNDGRLDILLTGSIDQSNRVAEVWRNTGSGFTNIVAGLPGVYQSSVAWGDYDNDGRLDILLAGRTNPLSAVGISQVWRNTGSGFTNINAGLPPVFYSSAAWGDYDNDGRLDILLTGTSDANPSGAIAQIWRNTTGGFANINAGLPGVYQGAAEWGDYDNDGRLDILLTGTSSGGVSICEVWRNNGNGFNNINAGLPGTTLSSSAWGDYDNDGRLDILVTGSGVGQTIAQLWRNTSDGFVKINVGLQGVFNSSVAWGDYDNDGRLDILLTGRTNAATGAAIPGQVWRNHALTTNSTPVAPSGLGLSVSNTVVTMTWNSSSDNATPAAGLTYNLRLGTTPGGSDVLAPMSAANGFRRLPQPGGAQLGLSAIIEHYTVGTVYYWSVQAVDSAFAGSPFAPENSFKLLPVSVSPAATSVIPGDLNADGMVDQSELDAVLANYFPNSPFLQMTNIAGLGGTNVTFALSNSTAGAFSVEYTTNLLDWLFLGPATPRYEFIDTNAPVFPQRHYRLRWP